MGLRWLLVAFTALMTAALAVANVYTLVADRGGLGIATQPASMHVSAVGDGSPAERGGIRPGDRIAIERMSVGDTMRAVGYTIEPPGSTVHLVIDRAGSVFARDVVLDPYYAKHPGERIVQASNVLEFVLVAGLVILVLIRYNGEKAFAFWAFSTGWWLQLTPMLYHTPSALSLVVIVMSDLFVLPLVTAGLLLIAIRAPSETVLRRRDERLAIGFAVFTGIVACVSDLWLLVGRTEPPLPLTLYARMATPIIVIAMVAIITAHIIRATGVARIRLRWTALGFVILAVDFAFDQILVYAFPTALYTVWSSATDVALTFVGFGALAFSITRSELFDIGFVVNRTAIYAVTTASLVGMFAGLNWFAGIVLKTTGLALPLEVLLAGALGLMLNLVHKRVERAIDQVFFRRRYDAERRLRRVARGLVHATELDIVAESVVHEVCESLDLPSGALFRAHDNGLQQRVAAAGWPGDAADVITPRDRFLVHLAGANECLRLDGVPHDAIFPPGTAQPRIAFAMWSRRRLVGLALFSAHRSGAMLDPEEIESIEQVVTAAVAAFDRVDAEALRAVREEAAALRDERDRLLRIVQSAQPALPAT
jgi:hypothetical protein